MGEGRERASGSGYLVTDRLIITARHIVVGAPAGGCKVLFAVDDEHLDAKRVWMADAADLALLELAAPREGIPPEPLTFGEIVRRDGTVGCSSLGFPDASVPTASGGDFLPFDQRTRPTSVAGRIPGQDGLAADHGLTIVTEREVRRPAEKEASLWSGMSGAAVIVGRCVVGVVRKDPGNWERELRATALTAVRHDVDLCRWLDCEHPLPMRTLEPTATLSEHSGPRTAPVSRIADRATGVDPRAREFEREYFKTSRLCRMKDADAGGLGVRPARGELAGDDDSYPYIERTQEAELEKLLSAARIHAGVTGVLVYGGEAAGKTRLLFESVAKSWRDAWLIAPRPHAPPSIVVPSSHVEIAAKGEHEPVVVWFDSVGTLVSPGGQGFTSDDLNAIRRDSKRRPVLVACTYAGQPPPGRDDSGTLNETLRFVEGFKLVRVDAELDDNEMLKVQELLGPHVAQAIEESERQLGAFACGKNRLVMKYWSRDSDLDRDGHELVESLLAWRRGVSPAPVSKSFARRLWAAYRGDIGLEPDDEWWARVWAWAQESVIGNVRLLRWFKEEQGYGPDSVLDGEVTNTQVRRLHHRAASLVDEVASEDPSLALEIAALAKENGLRDIAEAWLGRVQGDAGTQDADRARALTALSALHAEVGNPAAAQEAEEALTADPLLGDTLGDEAADLGSFRRKVEARRVTQFAPPDEVTRLVEELFCSSEGPALGPYDLLERRVTLVGDAMYRYDVEPLDEHGDGTGVVQELLLFTNVEGELGAALWDQEVQTLIQLGERQHPALPRVLGGGYHPDCRVAWVVTDAAGENLDEAGPELLQELRADPARCVRELAELADALSVLHGHRMVHRNLWPGTIEVKRAHRLGRGGTLRLSRFEMSGHLDNLVRRAYGSADTRAARARHFYSRQGLRALQYFAPERIDAILGLPPDDGSADRALGDSFTADVFGLGATAYEWFVEPIPTREFVMPGSTGKRLRDQLRTLRVHMRRRLNEDAQLPVRLRDLLLGMLAESSSGRHTSADVVHALFESYDALQAMYEPQAEREPLVAFLLEGSKKTVHRWGWAIHDPESEAGQKELAQVIEDDLRGAFLVYSERGALDFVRRRADARRTDDREKAHLVLVGKRGAWFGHMAIDRIGNGEELESVLLIRYVALRHHAEPLLDQPIKRRISHVKAIAFPTNERLDAVRRAARGRPNWRTLQESVESEDGLGEEAATFLGAMRWHLDYQYARLRQREYAFVCDDVSRPWVTLRWDRQRDDERVQSDALLVALDGQRPTFGEFFNSDDAWTGGLLQIRDDERGAPAGFPVGEAIDVYWVADGELRVELAENALIPKSGWLRPADSVPTAAELRRQSVALAEVRYRRGLVEQLVKPISLGGPSEPWRDVGRREGLRGDGPKVARRMLVERPFFALHGPPGTGKSTVVSLAIEAYLRREPSRRILVAAQANDALDKLAEKVLARVPTTGPGAVVALRLGQERPDRPNQVVDGYRLERATDQMVADIRQQIDTELQTLAADSPLRPIVVRWRGQLEHAGYELQDRILRGANLVFATCSGANRDALESVSSYARFDWVIVEEAAKAWPSELAIPLVRGIRWTLVGDHLQLPAYRRDEVVEALKSLSGTGGGWSDELRAIGERADAYARVFSFFSELFKNRSERDPLEVISTQFRMRQPIAELVSKAFYEPQAKLVTDRLKTEHDHGIRKPALLCDRALVWLDTSEVATAESGRWCNNAEARMVDRLLRSMFGNQGERVGESAAGRLAILTPWHQQRRALRNLLPTALRDSVYTVDSFQGGEAEIVVVSLVRTGTAPEPRRRLGLLAAPERPNVMLSRAQRLLVIVGRFDTFAGADAQEWPAHWRAVTAEIERQQARIPFGSVPELAESP
jgi:hypothetical protein